MTEVTFVRLPLTLCNLAYWCFWDTSNPLFKAFQEFDRKMKAKSWFTATGCFMSLVLCELKSTRWQCPVVETWIAKMPTNNLNGGFHCFFRFPSYQNDCHWKMTQIGIMAKLSDNIQLRLILDILVIHFELLNDCMNHSNYHAILLNRSQHHHVTLSMK